MLFMVQLDAVTTFQMDSDVSSILAMLVKQHIVAS